MRGCAPRTRGRGDPCTRYSDAGLRPCQEVRARGREDVIALSAMTSEAFATKVSNRREAPHLLFSLHWVQGSPLPRVRGAHSPAFNFIACAKSRGVAASPCS